MLNLEVMLLCLSVTVVFCAIEPNTSNSSFLETCMLESNMPKEDLKIILSRPPKRQLKLPETQAQKCTYGCMMRKNGMINNGNISAEVLVKYTLEFFGTSEANKRLIFKKVEHMAEVCTHKDNWPTEECALASNLSTCIVEEFHKAGITDADGNLIAELNTFTRKLN